MRSFRRAQAPTEGNQESQKYLHTLPDADHKNLTALDRIRRPRLEPPQDPGD